MTVVRISDFVALTVRHKKASPAQGGRNKKGTIMQKKNDLFVITKAKDLAKYIITVTEYLLQNHTPPIQAIKHTFNMGIATTFQKV